MNPPPPPFDVGGLKRDGPSWFAVVMVIALNVAAAAAACATAGSISLGSSHATPARCPDGQPVKILSDPACGQACGYSCLPDRWR